MVTARAPATARLRATTAVTAAGERLPQSLAIERRPGNGPHFIVEKTFRGGVARAGRLCRIYDKFTILFP